MVTKIKESWLLVLCIHSPTCKHPLTTLTFSSPVMFVTVKNNSAKQIQLYQKIWTIVIQVGHMSSLKASKQVVRSLNYSCDLLCLLFITFVGVIIFVLLIFFHDTNNVIIRILIILIKWISLYYFLYDLY